MAEENETDDPTQEVPELSLSWIEPGILAASEMPFFVADIRRLHTEGIRAILTLTEQSLTSLGEVTPDILTDLDIHAHHIPIPDGAPLTEAQIPEILVCLRQAQAEGRPLLVHCLMGAGRTGTVLHLHYLAQGMSLNEARARVVSRRRVCAGLSSSQKAFLATWLPPIPNGKVQ